jgi:hypothetical protein
MRELAAGDDRPGDMLVGLAAAPLLTVPDLAALSWFRGRLSADPEVRTTIAKFDRAVVESFAPLRAVVNQEENA